VWPDNEALGRLAAELSRHAQMLAFADLYTAIAWSFALLVPFVLGLQRVTHGAAKQ